MLSSFSSYFYGIAISPSNPFTPAPPFSRSDRTLLPVAPAVDPRSCIHPAPSSLAVPVSSPHAVDLPSGFVPILDPPVRSIVCGLGPVAQFRLIFHRHVPGTNPPHRALPERMIPAQFRPPRESLLVDCIHMNKRRSHAPHQQQIHKIRASNQQHHAQPSLAFFDAGNGRNDSRKFPG